jgi:hypothetical protein
MLQTVSQFSIFLIYLFGLLLKMDVVVMHNEARVNQLSIGLVLASVAPFLFALVDTLLVVRISS